MSQVFILILVGFIRFFVTDLHANFNKNYKPDRPLLQSSFKKPICTSPNSLSHCWHPTLLLQPQQPKSTSNPLNIIRTEIQTLLNAQSTNKVAWTPFVERLTHALQEVPGDEYQQLREDLLLVKNPKGSWNVGKAYTIMKVLQRNAPILQKLSDKESFSTSEIVQLARSIDF